MIQPPPGDYTELSWRDADVERSLNELSRAIQKRAQDAIDWYFRRKAMTARASSVLRFVAIALVTLGGLAPIVKATFPGVAIFGASDTAQLGYFLLAFAAGCLAVDRYLGFSKSWIRYVMTALAIQRELEDFRLDWTRAFARSRGQRLTDEQVDELFALCKQFNGKVTQLVQGETAAWASEIQEVNTEVEKAQSRRSSS